MDIKTLSPNQIERFVRRTIYTKNIRVPTSLDHILINVIQQIVQFCPADKILVFLDDPVNKRLTLTKNQLVLVGAAGETDVGHWLGLRQKASEGALGYVYQTNSSLMLPGKDVPKKLKLTAWEKELTGQGLLFMPVSIGRSSLGAVVLSGPPKGKRFSNESVRILQVLASLLSSSLQNIMDAKRAYRLSITDNLTGLYNDRYFHESIRAEVENAVQKKRDLHLIFFDLDNLKIMNDTQGHLCGSRILQEVGQIIQKIAKKSSISARYGGDEFVIIVPKSHDRLVYQMAEKIRQAIRKHTFLARKFFGHAPIPSQGIITASFGISSLQRLKNIPEAEFRNELIRTADTAMYKAKGSGKNKTVWHE